jgi:hypothetical protein
VRRKFCSAHVAYVSNCNWMTIIFQVLPLFFFGGGGGINTSCNLLNALGSCM